MNKYLMLCKFSLKTKMVFMTDFLFSIFGFTLHMFVFNELWDYILKDKQILGYTKNELIWYIVMAEVIMYLFGRSYRYIAELIKTGDVANLLVKPIDFMKYIICNQADVIVTLVVNIISAVIIGIIMAGTISLSFVQLLFFVTSLIISTCIVVLLQTLLGLLAFFIEENEAFYLIFSKLMLILAFTPLEFFPNYIQYILRILPTTYAIYPIGKILVNFEINEAIGLIISQVISLIFLLGLDLLLKRKGVQNTYVNGG